jgi:hypothetical protein
MTVKIDLRVAKYLEYATQWSLKKKGVHHG